ncbi:MAG TPA: FAD:protein FMN transferase [Thermoleophilaceae bacterium]
MLGATCSVHVSGDGACGRPADAVERARRALLGWHDRFTRFDPGSELSRLSADVRATVPVSSLMARFARAIAVAGTRSGGLVDATLLPELQAAGYVGDLGPGIDLAKTLALAPPRRPARPRSAPGWRFIHADVERRLVRRPPGVTLDSGGLAKGLFADVLAAALASHTRFAVVCAGDLRVGGTEGAPRRVDVESPFDGRVLHSYELACAGVATSGIGRRSWLGADGAPAHHLLDPASGRPAFTGVVQATAIAPTALEAEWRAKAAVLSGPAGARSWLPHGGLVVLDDGRQMLLPERRAAVPSGLPPRGGQGRTAWAPSRRRV